MALTTNLHKTLTDIFLRIRPYPLAGISFSFFTVRPKFYVHRPRRMATVKECSDDCAHFNRQLAVIRTERQYEKATKDLTNHRTPLWTGMEVTSRGIVDRYSKKLLVSYAADQSPSGPYATFVWPTRAEGHVTGPIYLHNRFYVLSTDTYDGTKPDGKTMRINCLCQDGKAKIT